jgi:hypothetical protein
MLLNLFESQHRKVTDAAELSRLKGKYGELLIPELRSRVDRSQLDARSRKHWQRLLSKAR